MNNDRSPAWKMEKVVTINSEFSLCGLKQSHGPPKINTSIDI